MWCTRTRDGDDGPAAVGSGPADAATYVLSAMHHSQQRMIWLVFANLKLTGAMHASTRLTALVI